MILLHLSWEFIEEKNKILILAIFSWLRSCFLYLFLGQDIICFFSCSKACFRSFFLESYFFRGRKRVFSFFFLNSYFFLGRKRVFFLLFFIKSHSVSRISSPDSLLRRNLIKNLRRNFSVALKKHEIAIANKCVCFK